MTCYRTDGSTRGHGIWAGLFSLLIVCGCIAILVVSRSEPADSRTIAFLIALPLILVAGWVFAFSLCHVLRPQSTFVEITHERIAWRDWHGFGMVTADYPLASVQALKLVDKGSDCLILSDGTSIALPMLAIRGYAEFKAALQQVHPAIKLIDCHGRQTN
ncbi:hypothetical protein [Prosthecobacter vanneervenii]|uniref:Uncharacterized protein n=1 Tax=Prosthecobacter vanneervenii TaxID=48466 RepID=A0A7W7Y924_9BACT|nr:hypothetical protein [Prosthecobacter vanneervenii]MBB5031829.1 hypothetical protein [Prosthecobacter vanneervenii]